MSTAQIFVYKGNLAALIDPKGKFINDPASPGQMGAVISTAEVEITKEAKELIKKAKRSGGSFAELMLTEHTDPEPHGKSSIGIIGGSRVHYGTDFEIGRTCTPSILDDCKETEIEVPQDYKDFVDGK